MTDFRGPFTCLTLVGHFYTSLSYILPFLLCRFIKSLNVPEFLAVPLDGISSGLPPGSISVKGSGPPSTGCKKASDSYHLEFLGNWQLCFDVACGKVFSLAIAILAFHCHKRQLLSLRVISAPYVQNLPAGCGTAYLFVGPLQQDNLQMAT